MTQTLYAHMNRKKLEKNIVFVVCNRNFYNIFNRGVKTCRLNPFNANLWLIPTIKSMPLLHSVYKAGKGKAWCGILCIQWELQPC
jgi:hypothetical protein